MKSVGENIKRVDAFDKVTGSAKYIDDIFFPGMLYVKILRSPIAHGKILSIKTDRAGKIPGVRKIVTGKNCKILVGGCIIDQPPMATDKVRYVGEPVAAVVGTTPDICEEARDLIEVKYREFPAVFDSIEAAKKNAPLVHPELGKYKVLPSFSPKPGTNIYHHYKLRQGNVHAAFKKCDEIVEAKYTYPHVSHCQLEPHGGIARWDPKGGVEIFSSTQAPFVVRDFVSRAFNLPYSRVRSHMPEIGGGFGGKSDVTIEPLLVYIASKIPGQWVKLVLEREEMFFGSLVGRGVKGKVKMGARKDGKILATKIEMFFNAGAYGETAINVVVGGGQNSPGPYNIPNKHVDAYAVYTNLPYVGAFRGYGHPEGAFMTERTIDLLAKKLKMDPLKLRLKNCYRPGDVNAIGQKLHKYSGDISQCLKKAAAEIGWGKKEKKSKSEWSIGKSVCSLMKSPVMSTNAHKAAIIKFNEDGTVNLSTSTCEMGQGSLTVHSQIAADALEIPVSKIHILRHPDTASFPYEWQTVASVGTWSVGQAIVKAAEDALEKIKETAAKIFGVRKDKVIYKNGFVSAKNSARKIPLEKIVHGYVLPDGKTIGGPVLGYGAFTPRGLQYPDKKTGRGNVSASWTFGAQAVELAVNRRTKQIKIKKLVTVIDAGKIINPTLARGQIVGAMVMALGQALTEKIIYSSSGKNRNPRLTDYKIPTLEDIKGIDIKVIFVETPDKWGPFGARGLAEHGTVAIPPAVANAVANATGIEIFELPVNLLQADLLAGSKLQG